MLTRVLSFVLLFPLFAFAANSSVNGTVKFTGAVPPAEPIKMSTDAVCMKQNRDKPAMKQSLQVHDGKLANVMVYVKEGTKPVPANDLKPIKLDQQNCLYEPHVIGVRVNQPVSILNSDPTLHNVHSTSAKNSSFNVGMPTKGQVIERKFTQPEVMVKLKCDVHGWMTSYVGVFDHPYFSVTGKDGGFSLKDLPPGEYTLEAWHEKLGSKTQKITLTNAGGIQKVDFSF